MAMVMVEPSLARDGLKGDWPAATGDHVQLAAELVAATWPLLRSVPVNPTCGALLIVPLSEATGVLLLRPKAGATCTV